jgi:hypothetical protein
MALGAFTAAANDRLLGIDRWYGLARAAAERFHNVEVEAQGQLHKSIIPLSRHTGSLYRHAGREGATFCSRSVVPSLKEAFRQLVCIPLWRDAARYGETRRTYRGVVGRCWVELSNFVSVMTLPLALARLLRFRHACENRFLTEMGQQPASIMFRVEPLISADQQNRRGKRGLLLSVKRDRHHGRQAGGRKRPTLQLASTAESGVKLC